MPNKRLVELEWEETSGVDAPANDVPGWAVLKGAKGGVHHGKVLAQIKALCDDLLAREMQAEEEPPDVITKTDKDAGMKKAALQEAILTAVIDAWQPFATEVAAVVKQHGRSATAQEPLAKAFEGFKADVEGRLAKLQGTAETVREALCVALRDKYPPPANNGDCYYGPWTRDFDDHDVFFEYEGKLMAAPYMIDAEGTATIGDAVPVHIKYET